MFKRFTGLSVAGKLRVTILVTSLVGLLLVMAGLLGYEQMRAHDQMQRELDALAELVGDRSRAALIFGDLRQGDENLASFKAVASVERACLYHAQSGLFANYPHNANTRPCDANMEAELSARESGVIRADFSIVMDGELLGRLVLSTFRYAHLEELFSYTYMLIAVMVLASIISMLLSRKLEKVLLRPLVEMTVVAQRVSDKGDTSSRITNSSSDEFGTVATALNKMLDRVEQQRTELLNHQAQLQQEVERQTAEVRQRETSLNEAQRIAHIGNWEWDIQSGALTWSDEIYRIFGWQPQAFKADYQAFIDVIHPDDREVVQQAVHRALEDPDYQYNIIHRIKRNDGEERHVEETGRVERNSAGDAVKMVGVVHDITEQVKANEDMELFRMMIENSADPFFLIDNDDGCRLAYVNESGVRHYGYPREELLTWTIPDWDPNFKPEDLPGHVEAIKQHAAIGEGMTIETVHRVKGGDLVPVEVSLNLTRYKGHLCHFGYIKNITERKETEQRLTEAKERAEEAAAMKSEFLANMSHEIRTPMNAVINLSRLALDTDLAPDSRDYINKVLRAGENLLGIINDILDFSKIEAGMLEVENIPFSLSTLISDVKDILGYRNDTTGVELQIDAPEHLPYRLMGDPLRLRQVLINLLNNALKFTDEGKVELNIGVAELSAQESRLRLSVCDTGIGMSEEQVTNLFQAFQQADGSITRRYGGTGLGLAISQQLVSLMGGKIEVQSRLGEGSCFSFDLVMPRVSDDEGKGDISSDVGQEDIARGLERIAGAHVLLVEDNKVNQQIMMALLRKVKLEVVVAENGQVALELLNSSPPFDLVLMDLQMPVMDGHQATRELRRDERWRELPVVAMTAHALAEERERCLAVGMNDHATKPINIKELHRVLVRWIKPRVM